MAKISETIKGFDYKDNKICINLKHLLENLYGHVTFKTGPNPSDIIIKTVLFDDGEDCHGVLVVEKLREPTLEEQIQQNLHELGKQSKERLLELLLKLKEEDETRK